MKNIPELSCAIVEDLLPTYVERLTSEETNMAVEAHLASCPACAAKRTAMGAKETEAAGLPYRRRPPGRPGGGLSEKGAAQEPAESMAGGGLHHAGAGGSDSYKNLHHWRAGTSQ